MNGTMIQLFHWYSPADGTYWNWVREQAPFLASLGITAAWLPPACKATDGANSVGYDVYDLYDLGEFDQKGSVRTRYGTRDEYAAAVKALQEQGIQAIADIVLNHLGGGDETETVMAIPVDPEHRITPVGEPREIEAYTLFKYPARGGKYSEFVWTHQCFSGVDWDARTGETGIYSILQEWGDDWEEMISDEKGNYDYLMFNDVEFRNPAVREELYRWGRWYHHAIGFDGVRLDAVKHISPRFYNEWLDRLRADADNTLFAVGEYWAPGNLELLLRYLEATGDRMSLFDSALHHRLHEASKSGNAYNLAGILNDSLMKARPDKAVTVVENHDTQPLQALEAPVEPWFKPLAYALILLREEGYPCIFAPDLWGASYKDTGRDGAEHEIFLPKIEALPKLLQARRDHAWGLQREWFDHPNCVGWTRGGDEQHSGCAVVLSNGDTGFKHMEIGARYAGQTFRDLLGHHDGAVVIDEAGWAEFPVSAGSVSVWVA
ncbi:alpha-amylase [Flaviaesturariibacter flavus]|uniref:Alpha-amylase n=1 Tax=Flaviaesturariibacter flavus TaxID=2502780 RepID=A0A4R1BIH6_9BACT|nr:alpha-amylase [Flaviaesturariibacter flavus]TCJ17079.1 alpha-amylase [Flaviaesturariibacter flavus]